MDNQVGLQVVNEKDFPPLPKSSPSPTTSLNVKISTLSEEQLKRRGKCLDKTKAKLQKQLVAVTKKKEEVDKTLKKDSPSPQQEMQILEGTEKSLNTEKEIQPTASHEEKDSDKFDLSTNQGEQSPTPLNKVTSESGVSILEKKEEVVIEKKEEITIEEGGQETSGKVVNFEESIESVEEEITSFLKPLPLYKETSYHLENVARSFFGQQAEVLALEAARLKEKLMVLQSAHYKSKEVNQELFNQEYLKLNQKYEDLKKNQKQKDIFEEEQKKLQLLHNGFEFPQDDLKKKETLSQKFISQIQVNEGEVQELIELKKKQSEYSENQRAYHLMKALDMVFWESSNWRLQESANALKSLSVLFTKDNISNVQKSEKEITSISLSICEHLSALLENIISVREASRIEVLVYKSLVVKQESFIEYCYSKNYKHYLVINDRFIALEKQAQQRLVELNTQFNDHSDDKIKCDPKQLDTKLEEFKKIRKEIDHERSELTALLERVKTRMTDLWKTLDLQFSYTKECTYTFGYLRNNYLSPSVGQKLETKETQQNSNQSLESTQKISGDK